MVQVTIEYMIMIPILIAIIFLLPLLTGTTMDHWVDSRQTLELENAASRLGSTLQQVYFSLNHETMTAGVFMDKPDIQPLIEGYAYNITGVSFTSSDSETIVVVLTLIFVDTKISGTTSVTLGQNVKWINSNCTSNLGPFIRAEKFSNSTIQMEFVTQAA